MINTAVFFQEVFPKNLWDFSWIKASLPFFTIVNVLSSGVLADYCETERGGNRYRMRGFISAFATIIAIPTIYVTFILQPSFWACAGSLMLEMAVGNQFFSLSLSMVNNILPANLQGTGIAIFLFCLNISFIVSQFMLSGLTKGINDNSKIGEMVGWISIVSSLVSFPFYIIGGLKYEKKMREIKKLVPNAN
jgi:hypothetical protein